MADLQLEDGTVLQLENGTPLELEEGAPIGLGPTIDVQPQNQFVVEGDTAIFTVSATSSGGALSYQWFKTPFDQPVSGETGSSFSIVTTIHNSGEQYYVIVYDDNGQTTSNTATLSVAAGVGTLGIISYPQTFPCPTWSYGTDTTPYPLRTQFDNGWTRQRRAFPQTGMSANLSFLMDTVMFEKWSTWVEANGWNWFRIGLDDGDGTILQEVRLITSPTWGYDAYDNVVAQITVEVSPDYTCREGAPLCKQYECGAYANGLLALNPVAYYPMNIAADLAEYPNPADGIKDYSVYGNNTYSASVNPPTVTVAPEEGSTDNCSGNLTFFNTKLNGGTGTTVIRDYRFNPINEWPQSRDYTYLVSPQGNYNSDFGAFRNEIDSGGRWTGCRLYCSVDGVTMNIYLEIEGFNAYTQSVDMTTLDPDWNNKVIGYRTTYSGNTTTMELLLDFAGTGVTCGGPNSLIFGQIYPGPQHIFSTGQFSNGKMQESALYNTALTDEQLLGLKELWLQSSSTYVDPTPGCS